MPKSASPMSLILVGWIVVCTDEDVVVVVSVVTLLMVEVVGVDLVMIDIVRW